MPSSNLSSVPRSYNIHAYKRTLAYYTHVCTHVYCIRTIFRYYGEISGVCLNCRDTPALLLYGAVPNMKCVRNGQKVYSYTFNGIYCVCIRMGRCIVCMYVCVCKHQKAANGRAAVLFLNKALSSPNVVCLF